MNSKQMKKWLEQQGATFQPGKGSHLKVFLNGRQSTLPMHGKDELGKTTTPPGHPLSLNWNLDPEPTVAIVRQRIVTGRPKSRWWW